MTILAAVADGPNRERVLDEAIELARSLDRELYILHLVDAASADTDARRLRDEVRSYVADADVASTVSVEQVSYPGARSGPRIAQELLDAAADVDVSHIVMGHAPKGMLENIREGSVAFAVADRTTLPLTIVPVRDT